MTVQRPDRPAPDAAVAIRYEAQAAESLNLSRLLLAQAEAVNNQADLTPSAAEYRRTTYRRLCQAADAQEAKADHFRELAHDARTVRSVSA